MMSVVGLFYKLTSLDCVLSYVVPYSDCDPIQFQVQSHCRIGIVCRLLTFAIHMQTAAAATITGQMILMMMIEEDTTQVWYRSLSASCALFRQYESLIYNNM